MKKGRSFRASIYILFTISILVPVLFISSLFSWHYARTYFNTNRQYINNTLYSVSMNMDTFMNELDNISLMPYLYDDIFTLMKTIKYGHYDESQSTYNTLESFYSLTFIKIIHTSSCDIRNIRYYPLSSSSDKCYEIDGNSSSLQTLTCEDYSGEDWFQKALLNADQYILTYDAGTNGILLSRGIKDVDTQKKIGVIRIDASFSQISSLLSKIAASDKSRVLLFDENNSMVYQSGTMDAETAQWLEENSGAGQNREYTVYYQNISDNNWRLVYLDSKSELFLTNAATWSIIFFIILIAVSIAFFVYYRYSTRMIQSVDAILFTMRRMQSGDLFYKSDVKMQGEFLQISEALNEMGNQLNDYIDREYKAKISQRNAEYTALQSQINPHFLCNALNGFIALNRMGEQKTLEQAISRLSQLFRYLSKNENFTTVEEEVGFVQKYIEIQQLRFEDMLYYSVNLEPDARKIRIPKLILQPIVENCIVHGLEPADHAVHIEISASIRNEKDGRQLLKIGIKDDGVGFDTQGKPSEKSVGLQNINERIHYFNESSTMTIDSDVGKGTVCTIAIYIDPNQSIS